MTVAYEDAMQIIEDPKAAAWELRDLAKSLLEDLQVARAAERERCVAACQNIMDRAGNTAFECIEAIRALGDQQ